MSKKKPKFGVNPYVHNKPRKRPGHDGGRSDSAQSFSESQSYGGGGTMGDLGADTFF